MTNEDTFIKKLEVYLDTVFDKYSRNRILVMLKEYREDIPAVLVKESEVTVKRAYTPRVKITEAKITDEQLMVLAGEICSDKNISFNEFMQSKKGKCRNDISEIRKQFCKEIVEIYGAPKQQLKNFFGVDHTTISYYLHGKKVRLLKKTA